MNFWKIIVWFWIIFALFVLYLYFFNTELFNQMFTSYKGAGSPFINTPN